MLQYYWHFTSVKSQNTKNQAFFYQLSIFQPLSGQCEEATKGEKGPLLRHCP